MATCDSGGGGGEVEGTLREAHMCGLSASIRPGLESAL